MEKEDQLIKQLIREGFLKSAPDDFTDNVMQAVAKVAESKKAKNDSSIIAYISVIAGSILVSASIMAYYKLPFFENALTFFGNFFNQVLFSFSGLFSGSFWGNGVELNSMMMGVILIMAALLIIDHLISRKRKVLNVFV